VVVEAESNGTTKTTLRSERSCVPENEKREQKNSKKVLIRAGIVRDAGLSRRSPVSRQCTRNYVHFRGHGTWAWREARFVAPLAWGLAKGDCVSLCPGGESLPGCRVAEEMS
jgi:hypothetical protein